MINYIVYIKNSYSSSFAMIKNVYVCLNSGFVAFDMFDIWYSLCEKKPNLSVISMRL